MFLQFKKLNNESGIVLFIVLMAVIIIMIISASILSQSMNEINFAQQQIDQIATDELSKGMFWNAYANGALSTPLARPLNDDEPEQGRDYQTNMWVAVPTTNAITQYNITSNYDSFQ